MTINVCYSAVENVCNLLLCGSVELMFPMPTLLMTVGEGWGRRLVSAVPGTRQDLVCLYGNMYSLANMPSVTFSSSALPVPWKGEGSIIP